MKQNKEQKWYPKQYNGNWWIENENGQDVICPNNVGEEQARENAILAASAPQWRELCRDMYLWLECYAHTREMNKHHPVPELLEQYEKLEKETGV